MKRFTKPEQLPRPVLLLLVALFRVWAWTLRVHWQDPKGLMTGGDQRPAVIIVWHNRVLFLPALLKPVVLSRLHILASQSRDGSYISQFLMAFGTQMVRGSSSKGGARALVAMKQVLDAGMRVVITPDGPRGPRYSFHEGAAWLTRKTGHPAVGISVNCRHCWQLKSWDGTQLPWPFSRVTVAVSEAWLAPDANTMTEAEWSQELARRLMDLSAVPAAARPGPPTLSPASADHG